MVAYPSWDNSHSVVTDTHTLAVTLLGGIQLQVLIMLVVSDLTIRVVFSALHAAGTIHLTLPRNCKDAMLDYLKGFTYNYVYGVLFQARYCTRTVPAKAVLAVLANASWVHCRGTLCGTLLHWRRLVQMYKG